MAEDDIDGGALRRLEERLDRAARAAERLLGDAAVAATTGDSGQGGSGAGDAERTEIPPAGWQRRATGGEPGRDSEIDLLLGALDAVRDRIPPELQRKLAEAVRELLLAVRALIDWYLEHTERRRAEPTPVQEIPIL